MNKKLLLTPILCASLGSQGLAAIRCKPLGPIGKIADGRPDGDAQKATPPTLAHPTAMTLALYKRLKRAEGERSAFFGQQHASWEGVKKVFKVFKTDIRDAIEELEPTHPQLTAAHPAIFGWNYETYRMKAEEREAYKDRIIETANQRGIITIHWPLQNFAMDCGDRECKDNDNVDKPVKLDLVKMIRENTPYTLKDEDKCAGDEYDRLVTELAGFLKELKVGDEPIPVIFRPFHEMNGNEGGSAHWWSGRGADDYKFMWQRLVDRLRYEFKLKNVMFAFAPRSKVILEDGKTYGEYFPEDANARKSDSRYVDITAFDLYLEDNPDDFDPTSYMGQSIDLTYAFGKSPSLTVPRLVAIAETGRKGGTNVPGHDFSKFWMTRIFPELNASLPDGTSRWQKVAYMMTWANGEDANFSTYRGAPDGVKEDFARWFGLSQTLFLDALNSNNP